MMKHKPYPKYKPSGIDWIGEIPEGWNTVLLRWISRRYAGGTPDSSNDSYWVEGTIPWINSGTVNQKLIEEPTTYITEDAYRNSSTRWVPKNALVMALAGQGKTKGMVAQLAIDSTCNQSMAAIIPDGARMMSRYLFWWLTSRYKNIRGLAGNEIRDGLNLEMVGSVPCPIPRIAEQKSISDFLDQKTAQIDDLIQKKEEMIKLLKEKRAAIINQAITKGLDPNAKMKSSGVDWIGDIPERWEVRRLKFIASTKFSNVDKHSKEEEQPVNLCNYVDVYYNDFIDSNMDFMQATATNDEIRKFALNKGDVIVTKDSESWDDIAIPAYVKEDMHDVLCGYHLAIIQANQNMCGEYIFWSFLSQIINYQFQVSATGVTRYGLGKGSLDNAIFFAPSKKEQHQIAKYLDQKTTEIDNLIQKIDYAIAKLLEYRSSLITAAVTGKIDVRLEK